MTVLSKGTAINHYCIVEKIGAGGMGEVYLAEDTTLDRKVALKFLPLHLCQDFECRARFKREAQATAKLDHPNIVAVHEVGEYQGRPFFAMQHVEGQTLKAVIAGKTLSLDRILEIGIQVCDGLQAAHEMGITHRDIKPSNILIDLNGRVRIVDFGLASVLGSDPLTKTGSTLGTVGYMSPEQVRGEKVHHHTDLFSLGVVLYELITGHSPFKADSEAATLHAITDTEPELLARYKREIPDGLQSIIDKALDKNVTTRYQHADEFAADLNRCIRNSGEFQSHRASPTAGKRLVLAIAIVTLLSVVIGVALFWPRHSHLSQAIHQQITFSGNVQEQAISPDGRSFAYVVADSVAGHRLCVRDIAGGEPLTLFRADAIDYCRWSPDGSEILFRETHGAQGPGVKAYIVPRLGGTAQSFPAFGLASWASGGTQIAYAWMNINKVFVVNRSDGSEREILLPDSIGFILDIDWHHASQSVLVLTQRTDRLLTLWIIDSNDNRARYCLPDTSTVLSPRWAPQGDAIYYYRDHGQTRDLVKLRLTGAKIDDVAKVSVLLTGLQSLGDFSISSDGKRLLQVRGFGYSNLWSARINRERGASEVSVRQLTFGTSIISEPQISPDGEQVAFVMGRKEQSNIFVLPLDGGQTRQLTYLGACTSCPAWSPDGNEIAFGSAAGDTPRVWRINLSGSAPTPFRKTVPSSDGEAFNIGWSPGNEILYQIPGNRNFHLLNPTTEYERPLIPYDTAGWIFCPEYSNNGQHIVVTWNRRDTQSRLWIINPDSAVQKPIGEIREHLRPVGWGEGDSTIYVVPLGFDKLFGVYYSSRIDVLSLKTSQMHEYARIPISGLIVDVSNITRDGKQMVYAVAQTLSDAWLIENFDPEVK